MHEGLAFSHISSLPPDQALPLPTCQGTLRLGEVSDLQELTCPQAAEPSPEPTWARLWRPEPQHLGLLGHSYTPTAWASPMSAGPRALLLPLQPGPWMQAEEG